MTSIFERICRRYLKSRGWAVAPGATNAGGDFFLFKYQKADGTFDYEKYRSIQTAGNHRKIDNVWADRPTIDFIASYLRKVQPGLSSGLCHGSRNGTEVRWFREALEVNILGTDISDTAGQFDLTQWDFHDVNTDWIGQFDFVYTNSHDHAYDPQKALETWIGQIKPNGAVLLEHTVAHSESGTNELDPFGVQPNSLPFLVLQWGQGKYAVTEVLSPPHTKPNGLKIWIFVIRKLGIAST